jgi:hypothetical protein
MRGGRDVLVLLFVAGALLLNFPMLAVANRAVTLAGIPVLYLYLFGAWAAGILVVFLLVRPGNRDED